MQMVKKSLLSLLSLAALTLFWSSAPRPTNGAEEMPYFTYGNRTDDILAMGLLQGNRPDVFSKVGDSITTSEHFMVPLGRGGLQLGEFVDLEETFQRFLNAYDSFGHKSHAAANGWSTIDLLTPGRTSPNAAANACKLDDTALVCEYRVTRPAISLIMIGTNDALREVSNDEFKYHMRLIIEATIGVGTVPIISTIPDIRTDDSSAADRVYMFNDIIRNLAGEYGIPLWDYWAQLQGAPNLGLSEDGYHPSVPPDGETGHFTPENLAYGYTVRNLTALQLLDALTGDRNEEQSE
jgi:hypothetical protein